jgi:hypothetical protein
MIPSSTISRTLNRVKDRLPEFILIAGIITTSSALLIYIYLGFFSRYYADDFCLSGMLFQQGFWEAQVNSYLTWSNRYAGMFLVALSELLGHASIRVWTALLILLGILSLTWTTYQIFRLLKLPFSRLQMLLLAELTLFFTILITPQLYQVLFWRIGLITYALPLIFLVFLAGLIIHSASGSGRTHWGNILGCGLLALFAGGFSETYLSLQTVLLLMAMIFVAWLVRGTPRRIWLVLLASALAGSLIALLVVIASPGNASRMAFMPESPGVLALVLMVFKNTFIFIYSSLADHFFAAILATLIPLLLIYLYSSKNPELPGWSASSLILTIFLTPLISFLLVISVVAPAAYVQSSYPDGRVLVIATFVIVLMLIAEGLLLGLIFSQLHRYAAEAVPGYLQVATALLLLTLLLYPLYDVLRTSRQIDAFKAQAASWDARDGRIRSARLSGQFDVQEKGYNAPGDLAELSDDPENWVNRCASWFYDLQSITVVNP